MCNACNTYLLQATLSDTMLQNLAAAVTAAVTEQTALDASAAAAAAGIMGGLGSAGQGDGSSLDSQQQLQAMAYMASGAPQGGYAPTSSPPYFASGAAATPFGSSAPVAFSAAPSRLL